jgi:hypothetical protein
MSDAGELRRQIIERARQAREQASSDSTSSSESSSSSSSEDSSSSEEEQDFKPVFVPKHSRVTEIERAKKETEAHEAQRMFDLENEQYLEQQRERAVADATRDDVDLEDSVEDKLRPPPIGDEDTEEAYQMWKIRELKRIMRFRGIKMDEEPETEETNAGTIKGAFYRDIIAKDKLGEKIDSSSVPEREQIASATNRMKSTLFKQVSASVEEDKSVPPKPPSAALTERLRIAQKFTKRSGGMKDL